MAERQSMTIDEVVRKVMVDEPADVLRASVRLVVQQLMDAEVSELIGAARGAQPRGPQCRFNVTEVAARDSCRAIGPAAELGRRSPALRLQLARARGVDRKRRRAACCWAIRGRMGGRGSRGSRSSPRGRGAAGASARCRARSARIR
jgi:hypothetical protein